MEQEKEIGIYEAKNRLSALIDEVAHGKRIWITRRGRRVAQLSSGVGSDKKPGMGLVEEFRRIRSLSKVAEGSLKELVEEGRK